MRTARLLTVSHHAPCRGVPVRGVYLLRGRVRGCTCPGGGGGSVPAQWDVTTQVVYLPRGVPAGGTCLGDVYLLGVYLPRGCTCPGGVPARECTCQGCTCQGVGVPGRGVPAQGVCTCWGCIPACNGADPPP